MRSLEEIIRDNNRVANAAKLLTRCEDLLARIIVNRPLHDSHCAFAPINTLGMAELAHQMEQNNPPKCTCWVIEAVQLLKDLTGRRS